MPNIKSAIKRVKVSQKKTAVNKMYKSDLRTTVKKTYAAIETAADNAQELVNDAQIKIDKAAGKGYTHKNAAARQKSRLAKAYNKMSKA
ncbi:MAG: small subunit ribosomal protein [Clostridiales bacterium]|jgi:small subunit ribosomal protein S20|nr:30S ribosomal protein S20 [Eubacteriales bacterium]MDD3197003.1 30S ribosomal protein S20 [Eubacteriales bacterium]MDD3503815.1 30S ribosomal protein S20 [Eubacteriales bacterium]MDD4681778.1 30S ribosomal protein S20 [Eubacteriales bacterium]MDN5314080.1 small subunit ribosomal protein [Clostridiales bacterium]